MLLEDDADLRRLPAAAQEADDAGGLELGAEHHLVPEHLHVQLIGFGGQDLLDRAGAAVVDAHEDEAEAAAGDLLLISDSVWVELPRNEKAHLVGLEFFVGLFDDFGLFVGEEQFFV